MKIAIMAPLVTAIREPQLGGSQAFVSDLARGLAGRGHKVHVYAASGSQIPGVTVIDTGVDAAALAATLYRVHTRHGAASASALEAAEVAFGAAYASMRQSRYDVIHNHAFDAPAVRLAAALPCTCAAHAASTTRRRCCSGAPAGGPVWKSACRSDRVGIPGEGLAPDCVDRRDPSTLRAHA